MNIKLFFILTTSIIGFFTTAMEQSKNIDLQRLPTMRKISKYISNVRRCDRAHAECYLADLENGEIIECSQYYENGTIICTHSISFFDTKPDLIHPHYFYYLKKISQKKSANLTASKNRR